MRGKMSFLQNAWYAARWESELAKGVLTRTITYESVVIVRQNGQISGSPTLVRITAEVRLGGTMRSGPPPATRPVRHRWPCTASRSCRAPHRVDLDERCSRGKCGRSTQLPLSGQSQIATIQGYLHVSANYELVIDNPLDLSHVRFLHPCLAGTGEPKEIDLKAVKDGNQVTAYRHILD